MLRREVIPLVPRLMPAAAAGLAMLGLAGRLLGDDATAGELQTVLRGLPHNVTTEMDLALWRAGQRDPRRRDGGAPRSRDATAAELAEPFHAGTLAARSCSSGLAEFLRRYGHRAVAEIDLGMPRWSDDPAHILGVLANYLRLEDPALAPDAVFARGAAEAERDDRDAGRAARRRRGRLRGRARALRAAAGRARSPACASCRSTT